MLAACADIASDGPERYLVRPEDTLYSIAWRHDLDYHDLARWNHIGSDYRIAVGQIFLPRTDLRAQETARTIVESEALRFLAKSPS